MLETILTEIIAGKRPTPHHMTNGARLDYQDKWAVRNLRDAEQLAKVETLFTEVITAQ